MAKKFYRVAREGKTVDGREITAQQIEEMATSYNPRIYGARIWLEHFRGLLPDSVFKALGDVPAIKASKDEDGKTILLAQLDPTNDLVKINKDRQKVYTSIEAHPEFPETGGAYFMGLAVTDSPASLGSEMLKLSLENSKDEENLKLYSEALETEIDFADDGDEDSDKPTLLSRVTAALKGSKKESDSRFGDIESSVISIAESQQQLGEQFTELQSAHEKITELEATIEQYQSDFATLKETLQAQTETTYTQRPPADGGSVTLTDC